MELVQKQQMLVLKLQADPLELSALPAAALVGSFAARTGLENCHLYSCSASYPACLGPEQHQRHCCYCSLPADSAGLACSTALWEVCPFHLFIVRDQM